LSPTCIIYPNHIAIQKMEWYQPKANLAKKAGKRSRFLLWGGHLVISPLWVEELSLGIH
jgi:hypothetical protein